MDLVIRFRGPTIKFRVLTYLRFKRYAFICQRFVAVSGGKFGGKFGGGGN